MIDFALLGTGGMMPLPDRALTAFYVRYMGHSILIDCGEGTQTQIRLSQFNFKSIDAIFITHFHGDHMSGLPGLLLSMGNESRTEPVTIYGPVGITDVVRALRVLAPELPYEVRTVELAVDNATHFKCIGLDIDAFPLDHKLPCLGYSIKLLRQGRFDVQKAKELGIPVKLWSRLQKGESVDGFVPSDVLGDERKGIHLLYATDTRPVAALEKYGKDSDLMVLEGIFGDEEKQARAEETRHMMMQEAAEVAKRAGTKNLWLTHYSPANTHPLQYYDIITDIFENTVIPENGCCATIGFEDE